MKTVTPNELGAFAESLLVQAPPRSEILLVQDGEPVAKVEHPRQVPGHGRLEMEALVERIRENRKGVRLNGLSIRELRDEGRP